MYFCCICGEEDDLHVLLLCNLEGPEVKEFVLDHTDSKWQGNNWSQTTGHKGSHAFYFIDV